MGISTVVALLAVALCIGTLARTDEERIEKLGVGMALAAILPVLLVTYWGIRELGSLALDAHLRNTNPLTYAFWTMSGVVDVTVGPAMAVNVLMLRAARARGPEGGATIRAWRRRLAPIVGVLGVLELVSGVGYFLF
jgi:hypothetical protein